MAFSLTPKLSANNALNYSFSKVELLSLSYALKIGSKCFAIIALKSAIILTIDEISFNYKSIQINLELKFYKLNKNNFVIKCMISKDWK